eukprot:513919-Prorocentrum_lima.AAC.1
MSIRGLHFVPARQAASTDQHVVAAEPPVTFFPCDIMGELQPFMWGFKSLLVAASTWGVRARVFQTLTAQNGHGASNAGRALRA